MKKFGSFVQQLKIKRCKVCGTAIRNKSTWCKKHSPKRHDGEFNKCLCGKKTRNKYCSWKCYLKYHNRRKDKTKYIEVECLNCNKKFKTYKIRKRKFCCRQCNYDYRVINKLIAKEKHPNWNPNKNPKVNMTEEWGNWRTQVYERDKYTCQICGQISGELHPHHIKPKCCFLELMYVVSNGITLCKECHMFLHKLFPMNQYLKHKDLSLNKFYDKLFNKEEDKHENTAE